MLSGLKVIVLIAAFASWTAAVPADDTRIIGGYESDIKNHPYLVSLRYKDDFRCGGTIVSYIHVVTASHCVEDDPNSPSLFSVRAGSSYINSGGKLVKVSKIWMHPNYNWQTTDYDIAVLKLAAEVPASSTVKYQLLATTRAPAGAIVNVAGWGTTSTGDDGYYPNKVRAVDVPVVGNAKCNTQYGGSITARMMCAGKAGKDSCWGDSGGPLIYNDELVGVVSWGDGCAEPNYPGVYADVVTLRPFLLSKL